MSRRKAEFPLSRSQMALLALILAAAGWIGLLVFTYAAAPSGGGLAVFFMLVFLAVTATATPLALALDARLSRPDSPRRVWRPIRQGAEVGLWVVICLWLQLVRLLDWITALLFLVILGLIEWFIVSHK
jgi:hypothetical protein